MICGRGALRQPLSLLCARASSAMTISRVLFFAASRSPGFSSPPLQPSFPASTAVSFPLSRCDRLALQHSFHSPVAGSLLCSRLASNAIIAALDAALKRRKSASPLVIARMARHPVRARARQSANLPTFLIAGDFNR